MLPTPGTFDPNSLPATGQSSKLRCALSRTILELLIDAHTTLGCQVVYLEEASVAEFPDVRVGDPERSEAFDRLTHLFTNGYLSVAEFDARTAELTQATYRSDLDKLFADMPESIERNSPAIAQPGDDRPERRTLPREFDADAELDKVLSRGKKVQAADTIIWSATMVLFFLGLFVFNWMYFWVVFPIAGLASWGAREFFGLGDEEEEIFEELNASETKKRAERLRVAMERRKELGQ